jgi:hypothetical protein
MIEKTGRVGIKTFPDIEVRRMKFPYGTSNFEKIRTEGYFYVDKTHYIEVLENMPESSVVILRSRRFGKTLFVNMLGWYYDRLTVERFKELFQGTYIYVHPTPKHNAYMMLTFNFSGINTQTIENANIGFRNEVYSKVKLFTGRYKQHFSKDERQQILQRETPNDILNALFDDINEKGLGKCLYVIIDEYDHFANNILSQGKEIFKDLVKTDGYVRPFYEALKKGTESVIDRIFITGVMPILLDSLTSGFNIGMNLSIDERFNEMFGFTEEEISPILDYLDNADSRAEIRTYYDGYRFSPEAEQTVYNSDMVLYYGLKYHPTTRRIPNMIDTNVVSDYRKIRAILSIGDQALEESVLTQIVEQDMVSINEISQLFILTQDTEFLFDAKALISLLFYMGYLTIANQDGPMIELKMPNLVLKSLYLDYMEYILMKRAQIRIDGLKQDEMLRDLLEGKIDLLIELTERFLKGLSNRDYERFDEKYIKVVMLSLLSNVNLYIPHSEYEVSADGYVDVYLQAAYEPKRSPHYFLELKCAKANAPKKILDKKEDEGIAEMRKYLQSETAKTTRNLQAYVLVFRKDTCVRKIRCAPNPT